MNKIEQVLAGLVERWRQTATDAADGDYAAGFTACADDLEAAVGLRMLVARCEGCGVEVIMPTTNRDRVYPDLPTGWTQVGTSRLPRQNKYPRLAAWCASCPLEKRTPAPQEPK